MRKVDFITPKSVISQKKSKSIFFFEKAAGLGDKGTPDSSMVKTDPFGEIINFSSTRMPLQSVRNSTCVLVLHL